MEEGGDLAFDAAESFCTPQARPKQSAEDCSGTKQKHVKRKLLFDNAENEDAGEKDDGAAPMWLKKEAEWKAQASMSSCFEKSVQETFSYEQKQMATQTWLAMTPHGMMCVACKNSGFKGPWSDGTAGSEVKRLRFWFVAKHGKAKNHINAVKKALGLSSAAALLAPELGEFHRMLEGIRKGESLRNANQFNQMSDKTQLIGRCLQEAALNDLRAQLRNAKSISLMRDARRQRLLIRYGLCDEQGNVKAGVLGMARSCGESGLDVVKATENVLKRVCTTNDHAPRWYAGAKPHFNGDLFDHARHLDCS